MQTQRTGRQIRYLATFRRLANCFAAGSLRPCDWHHETRLVMGLYLILSPTEDDPLPAMRRGILACNAAVPKLTQRFGMEIQCPAYDDSITQFYLDEIRAFVCSSPPDVGILELANHLLKSSLANPRYHLGTQTSRTPRTRQERAAAISSRLGPDKKTARLKHREGPPGLREGGIHRPSETRTTS